ncbi:hypothetical protein [Halalkalicoccus tibetensis]|uniref:Uncharacterized protein n=1 Tax=Halalkalicoccus tibetensis TaxID=175632 RepID=A0ABD5V5A6_9EURY
MSTQNTTPPKSSLATKVLYLVASVVLALVALWMTPLLIGPVGSTTVLIVFLVTLVASFAALLLVDARQ